MSIFLHREIARAPEPIGIIIKNESNKHVNVDVLGLFEGNTVEGISIANVCGDMLFDDNKLTMLKQWIMAQGRIIVNTTRLFTGNASQLGQSIRIQEYYDNGFLNPILNIHPQSHFNPYQQQSNMVQIVKRFFITVWTTLSMTILAGASLQIIFYPELSDNVYYGYNKIHEEIKASSKEYSAEKKKDFLFLMAS